MDGAAIAPPKGAPIAGDLPANLELVLGNQIYIAKEGLRPPLRNRLLRLAAFQNPEFYKAQAMRLSTYDKPRVIACAEEHPHHIGLPRGCLDEVRQLLDATSGLIRQCGTSARGHGDRRRVSAENCDRNSRRRQRRCWRTIPAYWRRPRLSERP